MNQGRTRLSGISPCTAKVETPEQAGASRPPKRFAPKAKALRATASLSVLSSLPRMSQRKRCAIHQGRAAFQPRSHRVFVRGAFAQPTPNPRSGRFQGRRPARHGVARAARLAAALHGLQLVAERAVVPALETAFLTLPLPRFNQVLETS